MSVKGEKKQSKRMGESSVVGFSLAEQISQKASGFIQSDKHRDLLDIVDSLRSSGVSHYVDLPQIIVCGSQSSGKSSTLEALSGIEFPTAEGLCTRFATELILRRGDQAELKVHIQPASTRYEEERIKLLKYSEQATELINFTKTIENAEDVMGLSGTGPDARVFSTDVLRIESISPTAPNLTIVDLPGLFGVADKNQSDDDATLVQNLVLSYMNQRRSIILAVISADSPYANQPVSKFARQIDPTGTRTLGLITKPDKIDKGSDSEKYYVELARNENVKLNLGWHVLRNKGHSTAEDTIPDREAREIEFFKNSEWTSALEASQLGVGSLRDRLRDALWKQIHDGLPGVKYDVQLRITDCRAKLSQLGKARSSQTEKHKYLHGISSVLSTKVRAAIDGVYTSSGKYTEDTYDIRRQDVSARHALEIVEDDQEPLRKKSSEYIKRAAYIMVVKQLMDECRGRELPGTFNPLVIGDLFSRQCQPWEAITQNMAEEVHAAATTTFNMMVSEICDENTRSRLMRGLIQPSLHQLRKDLKDKLDELLEPHLAIHPITYNDYLTETTQKIQGDRHDRKFDAISMAYFKCTSENAEPEAEHRVPLQKLLKTLKDGTRPEVEEYTISLCADVAAAYYKVALKNFIDDVSMNAVETRLVQHLPGVFSPDVAWKLSDQQVEDLGSEDDSTVTDRAELKQKLAVLEKGLADLDAFTTRSGK